MPPLHRRWLRSVASLALPLPLLCASCSSDPAPSEQRREIEYELFPSTHRLTAEETSAISEVAADGTLRFRTIPSALADLELGDVILAGISKQTPLGLLRVVLAIDRDSSGAMVLGTAAAPLQAAFRSLHAKIADTSLPFTKDATYTGTDLSPLFLKPEFSVGGDLGDHEHYAVVVFDGDGNTDTTNDQVLIDATLGGGFRYQLSIDMDWGKVARISEIVKSCLLDAATVVIGKPPSCKIVDLLPELTLGFQVNPHLEAALAVSGSASVGFQKDFDIATIALPPIDVGPLVFQPNVDIVASIHGEASASFSANAHANIEATTEVVLSSKSENSKIVPFALKTVDADAETPEVDLYAEAGAKAGARLVLALYGVIGPYAQLSAGATLIANPTSDPCFDLHVGLDTQFGVIVKTPSLPVIGAYTFLDYNTGPLTLYDRSVVQGSCDVTQAGAHPPPGAGPSAVTLQKPPFTPWATLLGLPADGSDLASVLAFPTGFPSLSPSVDGRYIASGAGARGLVKFDGDGAVTWQSSLRDERGGELTSVGSVASLDAGLLTLYRTPGFGSFVVAKQSQAGALLRSIRVDLPDACGASVQAMAGAPDGGALVVGECPSTQSAFLVRLDRNLELTDSRTIADADPTTIRLTPTAIARQGEDWVVAGQLVRTGETAGDLGFFLRFGRDLMPSVQSAFACPDQLSFYPTAAIPSTAGSITLVGDASGLGFVARVKPDGSLGFARFPNLGSGIQSGFSPNAVVELPTTGLVLASTVSGEGDNPTDIILLGLDGNGRSLWGREYFLHGKAGLRAVGWPSAQLTDDGGVLLSATAASQGSEPGQLLAMKVFARDGSLPDDSLVSNTNFKPTESDLAVEPRDFAARVAALAVTSADFDGTAVTP